MVPIVGNHADICQACREAGHCCKWPAERAHSGKGKSVERATSAEASRSRLARPGADTPHAVDAPSDVEASPGRLRPRKRQRVDKGKDKAEDRPLPAVAPLPHNPARGLRARAANDPETLYRELLIVGLEDLRKANASLKQVNQLGKQLLDEFARMRPRFWQPSTDANHASLLDQACQEYFEHARTAMAAFPDQDVVPETPSEPDEEYDSDP